ncbi:MAG: hypothetical protein ACI4W1_07565 [Ruminococcus sp.]
MNTVRFFTSGALFLFSVYCLIFNKELPFSFPIWVYALATAYFAVFPVKDMFAKTSKSLYKSRQFEKSCIKDTRCSEKELKQIKHKYDIRAVGAMLFWIVFMSVPGSLYLFGLIGREWIFFFFALSNFSVFFAVFFWCPFHKIFIRCECCMECRIYNWDSFFQYSFLIFIPNIFTVTLFVLGLLSLIRWEISHFRHPERFYKISNLCLNCENCDLEYCKKGHKKRFSKKLRDDYKAELNENKQNSVKTITKL